MKVSISAEMRARPLAGRQHWPTVSWPDACLLMSYTRMSSVAKRGLSGCKTNQELSVELKISFGNQKL